jgi:hypothetical protein
VEQENHLTTRLISAGLQPVIALHSFVFHFKSVTVKAANFSVNKIETRNNLSHYHLGGENKVRGIGPALENAPDVSGRDLFHILRRIPESLLGRFPPVYRVPVLAFAVSDYIKNPLAGDIFTAKELALHLQMHYHIHIKLLFKGSTYYDLRGVDILVAMLDDYDPGKIVNAKASLIKVAWLRNWFHRWISRPWISNFNLLLSSSQIAKDTLDDLMKSTGSILRTACSRQCPEAFERLANRRLVTAVDILRLATNKHIFR